MTADAAALIDSAGKRFGSETAAIFAAVSPVLPNRVVRHWVALGCPAGSFRVAATVAATEALAAARRRLSDARYWAHSSRRWGGVYQSQGDEGRLAAERATYASNEAKVAEAEADLAAVKTAIEALGLGEVSR